MWNFKVKKMILKLLKSINPVKIIKILKGSDKRNAVKGVLLMGGSGLLIPTGTEMIILGSETMNKFQLVGGAVLLIVGAFLALILSNKVKEIQNETNENQDN
jgi:hypothetical protein